METITNIDETVLGHPERNYKDKLFRKIFGSEDKRSARITKHFKKNVNRCMITVSLLIELRATLILEWKMNLL